MSSKMSTIPFSANSVLKYSYSEQFSNALRQALLLSKSV